MGIETIARRSKDSEYVRGTIAKAIDLLTVNRGLEDNYRKKRVATLMRWNPRGEKGRKGRESDLIQRAAS